MRQTVRFLFAALALVALVGGCGDDVVRVVDSPSDCFDFRDYLHTTGLLNTNGSARGIATDGDVVYVADGPAGLLVVDVSAPSSPVVAAVYDTTGECTDVAVAGDVIAATFGDAGIVLFDASVRGELRRLGGAAIAGPSVAVVVSGERAYVANELIGLVVVDISDPSAPIVAGIENTAGAPSGVTVDGDAGIAYVTDFDLGVRVVSVTPPDDPWLVTTLPLDADAFDADIAGSRLFIANGLDGVVVVDVSSPASPALAATIDTPGSAQDVVVRGGLAFVADGGLGLRVLDVADVAAPTLVSTAGAEGGALALAEYNGVVYCADGSAGLRVVDARNPGAPVPDIRAPSGGITSGVTARGDIVFVADEAGVLSVLTPRDGGADVLSTLPINGEPVDVVAYEGRVYVPSVDAGVHVIDAADPASPVLVGQLPASAGATRVAFRDSIALIVRGVSVPVLYDLRGGTPEATGAAGQVYTGAAIGDFASYLTTSGGRVYVVPNRPGIGGVFNSIDVQGGAWEVVLRGDLLSGVRAFVTIRDGDRDAQTGAEVSAGVAVYSLTNPIFPTFETLVETSVPARRVAFDGNVMYVAGDDDGLEVIDVTDPFAPVRLGSFGAPTAIRQATVSGARLFMAADDGGLLILPAQCEAR